LLFPAAGNRLAPRRYNPAVNAGLNIQNTMLYMWYSVFLRILHRQEQITLKHQRDSVTTSFFPTFALIKIFFLVYKEIQMGAVAKSYMRKGFLIYEEMRKYLVIYEETAVNLIYDFPTAPFWISLYTRKI
jgi:hypothetical protein